LEAVLRERLNSIEVAQLTATQNWLDELPTGKWAVFEKIQPADPMNEQQLTSHPVGCKKLLTYLTVNQPEMQGILNDWLCHVYVIENIQEGFVKKSLLNAGEMLVTPQGHMITRTSLTFYAPDSQLHGVLSRQQELKNIQITIDRLESQLHHQRGLLDEAKKQNVHLSNEIQQ
jgi:chromosome segregation protein